MNAKSDLAEEERKGGSGYIGKMVFSAMCSAMLWDSNGGKRVDSRYPLDAGGTISALNALTFSPKNYWWEGLDMFE